MNDFDLQVFVSDKPVGVLRNEDIETGLIDFEYLANVDLSLSVSLLMPPGVDPDDYRGFNGLPPPFQVSLPEGMVLDAIRTRFGKYVDVDNDIALLRLVGRHTVGRVTFGGPLEPDPDLDRRILEAVRSERSADRLTEILRASPQMFGISGIMPKMSVEQNGKFRPGTVVGHGAIVKFESPSYIGSSLVEYACLKACTRIGLAVPKVELAPDMSSMIVGRFDVDGSGRRLGFEDACALSGLHRNGKYKGSVEHLFRMIKHFVHPEDQKRGRESLLKMVVMNDVLRNGDAHLKNFGLLYGNDLMRPRLAPVYDVLTTSVWIRGDTPALTILSDDAGSGEWLDPEKLEQLRDVSGLPDFDIETFRKTSAEVALSTLNEVMDSTPASLQRQALERAVKIVEEAVVFKSGYRRRLAESNEHGH